jgi:hypothetical protein
MRALATALPRGSMRAACSRWCRAVFAGDARALARWSDATTRAPTAAQRAAAARASMEANDGHLILTGARGARRGGGRPAVV